MIPGNVFRLQLAEALTGRRRVALQIVATVLPALPFILIKMPARAQASGLVMVICLAAFFGSAAGYARLRSEQRLARLMQLPIRRTVLMLDLILSSVLIRLGPAIIVLAGFAVIKTRITLAAVPVLIALLLSILLLLIILGMIVGRIARNNMETCLFSALTAVVLIVISGLTPIPDRLSFMIRLSAINPITCLHRILIVLTTDTPAVSTGQIIPAITLLVVVSTVSLQRWIAGGIGSDKAVSADKNA